MSDRRDASRLARALIDVVAREKADGQAIERELRDFDRLVERHAPLAAVLTNPAVPVTRKHALVEQLLSRTVEISTITRAFLLFLAERDRLALLSDLVEAYRDRLLEHLKVVRGGGHDGDAARRGSQTRDRRESGASRRPPGGDGDAGRPVHHWWRDRADRQRRLRRQRRATAVEVERAARDRPAVNVPRRIWTRRERCRGWRGRA